MSDRCNGPASPIKWAGGKRWLTSTLHKLFPKKFDWYIEPFVGGASVFFSLRPAKAMLADLNCQLIETYEAVQSSPQEVWRRLGQHAEQHCDRYYYDQRSAAPDELAAKAARFLYLNRTCWNGLFRVNRQGHFNVPRGTKDRVMLDSDAPADISEALGCAELYWSDFEMIVDGAGRGDLVYADPPYTVKHNLNGFIKYNESIFSWQDQERLAESLRAARRRGATVVISNADHQSIRELYAKDFIKYTVRRPSVIAASAEFRVETTELLIVGR